MLTHGGAVLSTDILVETHGSASTKTSGHESGYHHYGLLTVTNNSPYRESVNVNTKY